MPGGPIVRVQGARQLRATLRKAGDDLTEMQRIHATVSRFVAARAAGYAPRVTGALAGSVRGSQAKTRAIVRAGGARVPYAGVIHWGWPRRNIAATYFASRAATDTEPTWLRYYMQRVDQIIATVKGK